MLFVEPTGSFNLQGALKFNQRIESTVQTTHLRRWARVEIFNDENTLGPMDAYDNLLYNFKHSKHYGCNLAIIVGGNLLVREMILSICDAIDLKVCLKNSLEEARSAVMRLV